ncbi:MAG: ubiquinol-cytochrome c reductase iron-sulfur subunit [Lautropia sp.]|nr:ubiquinol-cytochrome c reductase iron-sulfur subunit [Lautropia sp.]
MADTLPEPMDPARRNALVTTCVLGGVGAAGVAVPLVSTFQPSERAKAAGAPVEASIAGMQPGELRRVEWRGNPVWLIRRTPQMLASLKQQDSQLLDPNSEQYYMYETPAYAKNPHRSIKEEYLVVVGICSHLGCSPSEKFAAGPQPSLPDSWLGGFLCPCHGSTFDMAGRVFKNKPANANLDVPPHKYLTDTTLLIGADDTTG